MNHSLPNQPPAQTSANRHGALRAVDLFAGWGGFSQAAEQVGVRVVYAANHWPLAVRAHAQNHPDTLHECQDLRQADFTKLPAYDILLAAPACQGHSTAARPSRLNHEHVRRTHDALRATAWAVTDCLDATRPTAFVVENVPAFLRWELFPVWRESLRVLGYRLTMFRLNAANYGVPQTRERLFIIGVKHQQKLLPPPSQPVRPFGPCVEVDAPGWRPLTATTSNVRGRVERGRAAHGHVFLTQHVTNHPGVSLDEPIRTITTKDQWALVRGDEYRPLTPRELARGMGFSDAFELPDVSRVDQVRGLGNAVPPPLGAAVLSVLVKTLQ